MKLPSLSPPAQSALVLSVIKKHLLLLEKSSLITDITGVRISDLKCILLVSSPIAKAELSFVLNDLQVVLMTRGFPYALQLRLSSGNT